MTIQCVLAGDIGGTKTRLALCEVEGTRVVTRVEQTLPSADFTRFEDLLAVFRRAHPEPVGVACFGVAGPVARHRSATTTNLPWCLDAASLERRFGIERVMLLNDLEATAWGLPALEADDLYCLSPGAPDAAGNRAVIAAGTGLGEAGIQVRDAAMTPFATEGGHADFSPRNDDEIALLRDLLGRHPHVSWERLVSGPGLATLHEFLCRREGCAPPAWLRETMDELGAPAAITRAADARRDALCVRALEWFVALYGAEAGNLVLKQGAFGGLYIGGGIAPRILEWLKEGRFLDSFHDKGRMRPLLERTPVRVILNDRAALFGPALFAARLA